MKDLQKTFRRYGLTYRRGMVGGCGHDPVVQVQARTVRIFESVADNEGFANLCGQLSWNTV